MCYNFFTPKTEKIMPIKLPAFLQPKPAPKGKAPAKKTAAPKKDGKKPAEKTPAAPPPPAPAAPLPPLFNLSPERKLDFLGVGLALGGLLILLALISSSRSALTGATVSLFSFLFGWGAYGLPIALILFGGWLLVRKIERIPSLSPERATGLLLLAVFALTVLHGLAGNPEPISASGGGWLGSIFYRLLLENLGLGGALVVLLAWLLMSLSLTLDRSVPELLEKLRPLLKILNALWERIRARLPGLFPREKDSPLTPVPAPESFPGAAAPSAAVPAPAAQPAASGVPARPWQLPDLTEILNPGASASSNQEFLDQRARLIEETLASFGAPAQVVEINSGPTITQFGVEPLFIESRNGRIRVRVSKIAALADDLALALAASRIRIQAPVPGRSYLGIEVPNDEMALVALRDIVEGEAFQRGRKSLGFALGKDVSGHPIGADLAAMPHLLIAGTTGSGKSVCVNSILTCLLLFNTPDDVRLVLVDPKRVELTGYNGVPHLLAPVVVEMEKVIGALQWMTREMDRRYHQFAQVGARNIGDYNARMKTQGQKKLPFLVVVIDELADLMMLAPDETERTITRLAQLARATGIHLILATQRPSVDVVTGLIKANFPARVAFAVASNTDSRVILDQPGAERLLGRGDMLYQAPDSPAPVRLQGVFVSDTEIRRLVEFWQAQGTAAVAPGGAVDAPAPNAPVKQLPIWEQEALDKGDPLYNEALDLVRREGRASVSMLQRKLRIGYTRASRLIEQLEEKKIVGAPEDATGVRKVLDYGPTAPPKES
ncbi:MAG: DNA translocase FtsK [Anaerolineales bacterium]